ncbi:MAG TPA: hypothetical protein VEV42_06085 [Pyrinomonadaceae bacterium]|jgi:hypothetical protein|nr:hypothetical protein [Pyrinomonadaceae bacterium]
MKRLTGFMLFVVLISMNFNLACREPTPTPTPAPRFIILTTQTIFGTLGLPVVLPHPNVECAGQWESDAMNLGPIGGINTFFQGNSGEGKLLVPNARTPAFWRLGEFSGPCVNQSFVIGIRQNDAVEMNCDLTRVHLGPPFSLSPSGIDLGSLSTTLTITGQDIDATYGMPLVEYYNEDGNLVAQMQAASVAPDGTSLTVSTPDFSSSTSGEYLLVISNVRSNSSLEMIGSATLYVYAFDPPPPPPPDPGPCGDQPCLIY